MAMGSNMDGLKEPAFEPSRYVDVAGYGIRERRRLPLSFWDPDRKQPQKDLEPFWDVDTK